MNETKRTIYLLRLKTRKPVVPGFKNTHAYFTHHAKAYDLEEAIKDTKNAIENLYGVEWIVDMSKIIGTEE